MAQLQVATRLNHCSLRTKTGGRIQMNGPLRAVPDTQSAHTYVFVVPLPRWTQCITTTEANIVLRDFINLANISYCTFRDSR